MAKNRFLSLAASVACMFGGVSSLNALTLQESILEAMDTNPVVQERLKNFHETQQDLEIAKSEWLPSLDYRGTFGISNAGHFKDSGNSRWDHSVTQSGNYANYTNSLKLTQNIFNGFSTTHKMNYQEARIMAAAHHYVENANDIAFQMVGSYIDVIKSYKLLQIAKENVAINKKIYEDVQALYNQGLTTKSEMTKINASLSLANSNLTVQQNNSMDKEARFKRLFGRNIDVSTLELPKMDLAMPESIERAAQIAITNNPSLIVSSFNIKGAQELYKEKKSKFYPVIDLEFEQVYNDFNKDNSFDGSADDRQRAYVVMNWNLFKGGAHIADIQKSKSTINKEVELLRDLKRQTIEGLELSWNAYEMIGKQLKDLHTYYENSQETLESYQSEYEMGRRTLLDLLSAQNDLVSSKSQIVNAQMDKLYAQYRILDAMGMMVSSIVEDKDYNKLINPTINPLDVVKDELPVKYDVDNDGIVDSLDLCDNSTKGDNITPYGCVKNQKDSDFDGIPDSKDRCPDTVFGAIVDINGCEIKDSKNKFVAKDRDYIESALQYTESSPKKDAKLGLYDYEFNTAANKNVKSTELDNKLMYGDFAMIKRFPFINMNKSERHLDTIANELKKYNGTNAIVTLIGNTQSAKDKDESFNKGLEYAQTIKKELVNKGVDEKMLVAQSRVDYDRYFLETNRSDKDLNDVTAVALYVQKSSEIAKKTDIKDDDGDGVINELDKCPNTPKGYSVDENGCPNTINLEVLFENASDKVLGASSEKVVAFAKYLNDNKEFDTVISGHASQDKRTSAAYNVNLSQKRADAIKELLIKNGVEASRIQTEGKGYSEPIADNDTAEGQAKNRRIEAVLIKK
ncbi:TolC family outer membrane protein [Arcobacter vandammei]|uniref:TolC family outer membrane protein n=1 Tax=Arcobacter vandammei TaxID=2782243 RepID=UPI0018DF760B|nr:TolC family outer membrane protein [Arcobacter vandammei]